MVIEIKRSTAPTVSKRFHIARADLTHCEPFVVHGGAESPNHLFFSPNWEWLGLVTQGRLPKVPAGGGVRAPPALAAYISGHA